jgi:hypothetical protein
LELKNGVVKYSKGKNAWDAMAITKKPAKKFAIKFLIYSENGTVGFSKIPHSKSGGSLNYAGK